MQQESSVNPDRRQLWGRGEGTLFHTWVPTSCYFNHEDVIIKCPSCELDCIASLPHLQPGSMSKTGVFGKVTAELQHTQSHGVRNVNVWGGRRRPTTGPFVIVRISFWNIDFGPAGNLIYKKKCWFASKAVYRQIYSGAMKQVGRRYKWELSFREKTSCSNLLGLPLTAPNYCLSV